MNGTLLRRIVRSLIPLIAAASGTSAAPAHGAATEEGAEISRTAGLVRAHWDYPAKASVAFGVIVAKLPASVSCRTPCYLRGLTVQGAAGLGGGELAVGFGSLVGETGRGSWLVRRAFMGYGVRAAAVRTWGASTLAPEGDTFLGIEGAMAVAQFGLRLGVFRRLETIHGEKDWRLFGGLGWGF